MRILINIINHISSLTPCVPCENAAMCILCMCKQWSGLHSLCHLKKTQKKHNRHPSGQLVPRCIIPPIFINTAPVVQQLGLFTIWNVDLFITVFPLGQSVFSLLKARTPIRTASSCKMGETVWNIPWALSCTVGRKPDRHVLRYMGGHIGCCDATLSAICPVFCRRGSEWTPARVWGLTAEEDDGQGKVDVCVY